MCVWTFSPYNLPKWNQSKERILFVAAEPNGEQPNGGYDMGEWFRTAPQNEFWKNQQFYRRTEIILEGMSNDKSPNIFDNFRFMDLKATSGGGQANRRHVKNYVRDNLNEVIRYFNSTDEGFGLSPHLIVLLGNTAQSVFNECVRPRLLGNNHLEWIGMPHPSHTVGYDGLVKACTEIRNKDNPRLKPINQEGYKWIYDKKQPDRWVTI